METFQELQDRVEQRRKRKAEAKIKGIEVFLLEMRVQRADKQSATFHRRYEIRKLASLQHDDKYSLRELSRQISLHENELKELREPRRQES
jgi:hypothetical protein